jgi:hypothetical protein
MRISDAILSDRDSALMSVRRIHLLRTQNLQPCDAKDTHGRRGPVIQTKLGSIASGAARLTMKPRSHTTLLINMQWAPAA